MPRRFRRALAGPEVDLRTPVRAARRWRRVVRIHVQRLPLIELGGVHEEPFALIVDQFHGEPECQQTLTTFAEQAGARALWVTEGLPPCPAGPPSCEPIAVIARKLLRQVAKIAPPQRVLMPTKREERASS